MAHLGLLHQSQQREGGRSNAGAECYQSQFPGDMVMGTHLVAYYDTHLLFCGSGGRKSGVQSGSHWAKVKGCSFLEALEQNVSLSFLLHSLHPLACGPFLHHQGQQHHLSLPWSHGLLPWSDLTCTRIRVIAPRTQPSRNISHFNTLIFYKGLFAILRELSWFPGIRTWISLGSSF